MKKRSCHRDQIGVRELSESKSLYENVVKVQDAVKTDDIRTIRDNHRGSNLFLSMGQPAYKWQEPNTGASKEQGNFTAGTIRGKA